MRPRKLAAPRNTIRPRLSWAPLSVGIVAAVVLLGTAWSAERAIERAADAVAIQEGQLHAEATHAFLRASLPKRLHEVDLAELLASRRDAGLSYAAVLSPEGKVEREAGDPPGTASEVGGRGLVRIGDRYAFSMTPPGAPYPDGGAPPPGVDHPPPGGPPDGPTRGREMGPAGPRPPTVVVAFDGRGADSLRSEGRRLLTIGAATAALLVMAAFVLARLLGQRESLLRAQARDRQLAVLGEMTAVIAHELRNPLASLKGHAQLLEEGLVENPKQSKRATRVVKEAVRLERLGADLIAFVRAGTVDASGVVVADVVDSALDAVERARVELHRGGPSRFSLDATKIQQVLVNLLDNAIQASPPGASVELRVGGDDDELRIEVSDRGAGVPKEDRDRIFEPFVTTRARGTGLGLAFARRVVELHGGSLSVEDVDGGGALFRMIVPRRR